jgi:hypothetical protein
MVITEANSTGKQTKNPEIVRRFRHFSPPTIGDQLTPALRMLRLFSAVLSASPTPSSGGVWKLVDNISRVRRLVAAEGNICRKFMPNV